MRRLSLWEEFVLSKREVSEKVELWEERGE